MSEQETVHHEAHEQSHFGSAGAAPMALHPDAPAVHIIVDSPPITPNPDAFTGPHTQAHSPTRTFSHSSHSIAALLGLTPVADCVREAMAEAAARIAEGGSFEVHTIAHH